jgi:hypothetical protein
MPAAAKRKVRPAKAPLSGRKAAASAMGASLEKRPEILSQAALNRALLARQWLLARVRKNIPEAIERLVGMQAQVPITPYFGLWSRLTNFKPERLSELIETKQCLRATSLRGTLHLMTADDALALRPTMQPVFERALYKASPYGRRLGGVAVEELSALGLQLLERAPCTLAQLREALQERYPGHDAQALAYAVHYTLPLVQLPPRGLWHTSGQPICTTLSHYLSRPLGPGMPLEELLLRYLRAFGPASVADAQTWSGLQKLGPVFEQLRPQLRCFRSERGTELFDLPDGECPHAETPAPARFLPEYDNALLGLADRSRFSRPGARTYTPAATNESFGTLLVDGLLSGVWKFGAKQGGPRKPKAATKTPSSVRIVLLARLSAAERRAVEEEAQGLLLLNRSRLRGGSEREPGEVCFVEQL